MIVDPSSKGRLWVPYVCVFVYQSRSIAYVSYGFHLASVSLQANRSLFNSKVGIHRI